MDCVALQCVCCGVLQCVAVCCSVLQCVAVNQWSSLPRYLAVAAMVYCDCVVLQCACSSVLQCIAVCCSVLQCVAVCCSVLVLKCVAVCCNVSILVTSSVSGGSGNGKLYLFIHTLFLSHTHRQRLPV